MADEDEKKQLKATITDLLSSKGPPNGPLKESELKRVLTCVNILVDQRLEDAELLESCTVSDLRGLEIPLGVARTLKKAFPGGAGAGTLAGAYANEEIRVVAEEMKSLQQDMKALHEIVVHDGETARGDAAKDATMQTAQQQQDNKKKTMFFWWAIVAMLSAFLVNVVQVVLCFTYPAEPPPASRREMAFAFVNMVISPLSSYLTNKDIWDGGLLVRKRLHGQDKSLHRATHIRGHSRHE